VLDSDEVKAYVLVDAALQHGRCFMQAATRTATHRPHETSLATTISGWAQQGVQSFFATQRILLDLAMRQNTNVMHALRRQFTDPHHSPVAVLGELAGEGLNNFIEGQKILLDLGKQQNQILMKGLKERVGEWPAALNLTNVLGRSVETFLEMQEEFLKVASKQTHTWREAAKAGKPLDTLPLTRLAREAMQNFVKAQKEFLDLISEETGKAGGRHHKTAAGKKIKKTEVTELVRQATESFIQAQRKLVDVAGKQVNASVKSAGTAMELLRPFPFVPFAEVTREVVKSYVEAQKALTEAVVKPVRPHKHAHRVAPPRGKKAAHIKKHETAVAA
jgi:hypothetical protein